MADQDRAAISDSYAEGYIDGLRRAADFVVGAPTLTWGQRRCGVGGFARVLDHAVDPDGDPDYVHNIYALRDAVLGWIEREIAGDRVGTGGPLVGRENGSSAPPEAHQEAQ